MFQRIGLAGLVCIGGCMDTNVALVDIESGTYYRSYETTVHCEEYGLTCIGDAFTMSTLTALTFSYDSCYEAVVIRKIIDKVDTVTYTSGKYRIRGDQLTRYDLNIRSKQVVSVDSTGFAYLDEYRWTYKEEVNSKIISADEACIVFDLNWDVGSGELMDSTVFCK